MGCEIRRNKESPQLFGLSNLRMQLPFRIGEAFGKNRFAGGKQEFCCGHVRLEEILDTMWRCEAGNWLYYPEFRGKV